ncbi:MAG: orotate phosphoribosyltransferase [Spirochaetia bacterium]|nr:orotate phosphoribosyltransferase [Spirochaetia bacterium]MCF7941321.1 orotate phosphoribosyltransferase [Spirochaetia bacterium]
MDERPIRQIQNETGVELARKAFEIGALRLNTSDPFQWASGYRMPIYNDNRQLLQDAEVRSMIARGFADLMKAMGISPDGIAGTATAGIPHATTLADLLGLPLTYVRSSSKGHGLKNMIEGLGPDKDYEGRTILLIEDLISTGGSSIKAVEAIREANGRVPACLAIFTYGLQAADENFSSLQPSCTPVTILTYDLMIEAATAAGYIDQNGAAALQQWRRDPFGWGASQGFPKVEV